MVAPRVVPVREGPGPFVDAGKPAGRAAIEHGQAFGCKGVAINFLFLLLSRFGLLSFGWGFLLCFVVFLPRHRDGDSVPCVPTLCQPSTLGCDQSLWGSDIADIASARL